MRRNFNADEPVGTVSALRRDGFRIRNAEGAEVQIRGLTAFSALDDWLNGDRAMLEDYADWSQGIGVNCWRVFAIWNNLKLTPRRAGYYDDVLALGQWLNGRGIYLWMPFFCDQTDETPDVKLTGPEAATHITRMRDIMTQVHGPQEGANEYWQNLPGVGALPRLGSFCTRSATRDTELPDAAGDLWDFTTHHTPRGEQQTRKFKEMIDVSKLGFTGWQPSGRPALAGEPPRIAEDDWTDPQKCADYFAGCDLYGNGAVIHGGWGPDGDPSDLQRCRIPTDETALACIRAISDAWKNGVPMGTFADGRYLRGNADNSGELGINHADRYTDAGENPAGSLRTFAMQVGNRQVIIPVDRGPQWSLGLRNGYRLVETRGYNGNVVIVER